MTDPSISSNKKPSKGYNRDSLIYYMGEFINDSPPSLASLKKIVASNEFASLLKLLSAVGTQNLIKLLESASRDCAAKKAERAEKTNVRKRAEAVNERPGNTKRAKLHETDRSSNHAKGTAYGEFGVSEQLPAYSEGSNIQIRSEEGLMPSGLHKRNQTCRHELGPLRSRDPMHNAEDEDHTMLALGPDTAILRRSDPSSNGDNSSRPRVKTEYEDPSSESGERSVNSTRNPGQVEDEQSCTGKTPQSAHSMHPSEAPGAKEKALQLGSWDTYKREVGIIRRDPKVIAPIENHCCKAQGDEWGCHSANPKKELGDLLNTIKQLDFSFVKTRLIRYLSNRQAKLGIQLETQATWTMSEPQHILGALNTIKTICDDAQIHRAFGQMRLYLLVHQKLESGHKPVQSGKGKPRLPEKLYLEELARREAGPVSEEEIEARFHDYHSEYQAGRRWLEVADWFGGPGIVLVFITAGTSGSDKEERMYY